MIFTTLPTTIQLPSWGQQKKWATIYSAGRLLNQKATPVYMKMVLRIYLLVRAQQVRKQITGDFVSKK